MPDHYRRKSWVSELIPAPKPQVPEQLQRWLPDTHLRIRDALALLGRNEISGWNDTEMDARWVDAPPDRPWHWRKTSQPQKPFAISKDDEIVECTEEQAEKWWSEIEPVLVTEWEAEKVAKERWAKCLRLMRNRLAAGTYQGFVLDKNGTFEKIPSSEWISHNGQTMLLTGVAKFGIPGMMHLIDRDGPAVLTADFMSAGSVLPTGGSPNLDRFPYVRLLLAATNSGLFTGNGRVEKKVIEHWLEQNWPQELGQSSSTKIATLATYLRRPEDEKGGLRGKGPDP